jgi:hypothetical protein
MTRKSIRAIEALAKLQEIDTDVSEVEAETEREAEGNSDIDENESDTDKVGLGAGVRGTGRGVRGAKTYLTGTMRKNKKELPSIVKTNGTLHSSLFFEDVVTGTVLTIYQCKSNNNVVVLSTEIDEALVPTKIDLKRKYVGRYHVRTVQIKRKEQTIFDIGIQQP